MNGYAAAIWRDFQECARNGLSASRRRALPEDDPRHLPDDDQENDE